MAQEAKTHNYHLRSQRGQRHTAIEKQNESVLPKKRGRNIQRMKARSWEP